MKHKLRLLRIYFRHHDFDNEKENSYHYFFNQIALLIVQELDNYLTRDYRSFVISLGTLELWSKFYDSEEIPNIHYLARQGNTAENFEFDKFFKLEVEDQKLMVFNKACNSLASLARKGKQLELESAINKIKSKYASSKKLNCEYIALNKDFICQGINFTGKIIFKFLEVVYVNLTIEYRGNLVEEFKIWNFDYGYIDWLITVFKKLEVKNDLLILKGHYEIEEFPMSFDLDPVIKKVNDLMKK